jgi:hypothetical protein
LGKQPVHPLFSTVFSIPYLGIHLLPAIIPAGIFPVAPNPPLKIPTILKYPPGLVLGRVARSDRPAGPTPAASERIADRALAQPAVVESLRRPSPARSGGGQKRTGFRPFALRRIVGSNRPEAAVATLG